MNSIDTTEQLLFNAKVPPSENKILILSEEAAMCLEGRSTPFSVEELYERARHGIHIGAKQPLPR